MKDFNQIITKLNEDYQNTVRSGTGDMYGRLSTIFGELDQLLREYLQDMTGDKVKQIIKKLKGRDPIAPDDLEIIRLWLVGDADYYLKYENNYNDWTAELKRLMQDINTCNVDSPDVGTVTRLRSLFRDASRVIADLFYYTEQKDRVMKFSSSTEEIDDEERAIIARLLEQKLKSQDF
jgi:hypothetical protein